MKILVTSFIFATMLVLTSLAGENVTGNFDTTMINGANKGSISFLLVYDEDREVICVPVPKPKPEQDNEDE
jgi:hypothetical protein